MDKYKAVVKSLQERSQHVLPLRYRREVPLQAIPVEALCEYESEQVTSPLSHEQSRGAAGDRLLRGHWGGRDTWGKSSFCQCPSGNVSRSRDKVKVMLALVGKQVLQLRRSSAGGVWGKCGLCLPCRQHAYHTPFGRLR